MDRVARWSTAIGLAACVAGLLVLLAASVDEVTRAQAATLVDGYWLGRLPWIAVGVDLTVIGATVAVVAGTVAAWITGGWVGRIVTAIALAVAGFWWYVALMPFAGGAYCPTCAPRGPDPMSYAYSLPEFALALLVVPAVVVGAIVLLPGVRSRVAGCRFERLDPRDHAVQAQEDDVAEGPKDQRRDRGDPPPP